MGRGVLDKAEWEEVCEVEAKERSLLSPGWLQVQCLLELRKRRLQISQDPALQPQAASVSFSVKAGEWPGCLLPSSDARRGSGGQPEPPRKHLHIPDACGQQWRRAPGPSPAPHPVLAATLETGLGGEWAPERPPADVT